MDSCQYQEIKFITDHEKIRKEKIKSTIKQVLIASTSWMHFFIAGLCSGTPTVFIPQIRNETNSTFIIDEEMASWLYSTHGFAMYPWVIILPLLTKIWGRKLQQLAASLCSLIFFTILYFSKTTAHILISQAVQGFLYAGNLTIRILIITEYVLPKYRGLFLTIKSASFFWGIWVANAIGTYFYWKYIAIFGIICSTYTFVFTFCPESPCWLASKGRIEESKTSYRWIYGSDEDSENKLQEMIAYYSDSKRNVGFIEMVKSKDFYKPMSLSVVAIIQYNFTGKVVCAAYILDIFKSITDNKATAYSTMLILDGVTVFGMYFGSFLCRYLNRRTLYITSSFVGVLFLFVISFYLYLVRFAVVTENIYVTVTLLVMYSLSIGCGPIILCTSIFGEIIPVRFQASCYIIIGFVFSLFFSLLLKLSPIIFATFGVHGTFLFYCVTCGLCTTYLHIYLPETKNKTHEEIELFFKEDK